MILPDKHIALNNTLMGSGAKIIKRIITPVTLSSLWEISKKEKIETSYEKFILTLDFLYMIGFVEFKEGFICRIK